MKHYIHTLKTKLTIGSIRNQTRSNILRCCTARLQFIKGHEPLVLGAAISNGCILMKGPKSIHGPGITLRLSCSKAAGSLRSIVQVRSEYLGSGRNTTISPIQRRPYNGLSVLSRIYIDGSCKNIRERNNGGKREFGTFVLEKVHKTILVFPYLLSEKLFPALLMGFSGISLIWFLYFFPNGKNVISPQTLKTIADYQTFFTPYTPRLKSYLYPYKPQDTYAEVDEEDFTELVGGIDKISGGSYIRKYILIRLEVGKNIQMDENDIFARVLRLFCCESIIVGEEPPVGDNRYWNIGIWNTTASKNTFQAYIRRVFPELRREQLRVVARKSWTSVLQSIREVSDALIIWKEGTPPSTVKIRRKRTHTPQQEQSQEKRKATTRKEGNTEKIALKDPARRVTSKEILELLREKENWSEVVHDPILGPRLINNYLNIRNTYTDLQIAKIEKELEDREFSLFRQKVTLLYHRMFHLDKALALRFTVIFSMSLIFGSLSLLFGELNPFWEFIVDLLQKLKSNPEPESEPALNQQTSDFRVGIIIMLIIYLMMNLAAKNN